MKMAFLTMIAVSVFAFNAHATCSAAALWVAETEYGNDPMRTSTKTIEAGRIYEVSVGKGNPEDGEHTYRVIFTDGTCNPKTAQVCDLTQPDSTGTICK